jgi:hypothetical protein
VTDELAAVERQLSNWQAYMLGTGRNVLGYALSGWHRIAGGQRYRSSSTPYLAGEAADLDGIIGTLTPAHRAALHAWYLRPELRRRDQAALLGCSPGALADRVRAAKWALHDALAARRVRRTGSAARSAVGPA